MTRLNARIVIGVTVSTYVQASANTPPKHVVQALHQALVSQEPLEIRYRREDGATSTRDIEPYYLLLKYPIWYVVAFDHQPQSPRTFRCDRMLAARMTGAHFDLSPPAVTP